MSHAHRWKLDGKGYGVCQVPGCGAERQFKNSWDVKQTDPLRRPREQVAQEVAALDAQYRSPWVKATRMGRVRDSRLRQE